MVFQADRPLTTPARARRARLIFPACISEALSEDLENRAAGILAQLTYYLLLFARRESRVVELNLRPCEMMRLRFLSFEMVQGNEGSK